MSELRTVGVDRLRRGKYQPRETFTPESLQKLADSIRSQGVVQPIVVRPVAGTADFEILAGERRWRAAQIANLHEVPVIVRNGCTDQQAAAIALIENIQREGLNPIEEAIAYKRFADEFGMSHTDIAAMCAVGRASVSNKLRLLDLHPAVLDMVRSGQLEESKARPLLALPARQQEQLARETIKRGYSTRLVERKVRALLSAASQKPSGANPPKDSAWRSYEQRLSDAVGNRVAIEFDPRSKNGELHIKFNSLDELEGIAARLLKQQTGENDDFDD